MDIFRYADSAYNTVYLVLSYIEKLIPAVSYFLVKSWLINCWLIYCMSWMSLIYAISFRHIQKIKHCICLRLFSVFIYGKFNSNFELNKSGLHIINVTLGFLMFLGSADNWGYLVVTFFVRCILNLVHFSDFFSYL